MRAIEGIFFDLDGTLLDTADDFVVTVNQMLADHQRPPVDGGIIRQHVSCGARKLMQLAFNLSPGKALEEKRELFLYYYDQHIKDHDRSSFAHPYPGILPLLEALESRNIAWGIITNKPKFYTIPLMEQVGLMQRSQTLICPEDVTNAKPDPQALFLACEQTRCTARNCVYIGDHARDIAAGKSAGMTTVAAHYGYIAADDNPNQWQADVNIHNVPQLHQWLEDHNWRLPSTTPAI